MWNTVCKYQAKQARTCCIRLQVFRLCGFKPFVQNSDKLLATSRRILGDNLTFFFVRHTFFNHFCAGEAASNAGEAASNAFQLNSA